MERYVGKHQKEPGHQTRDTASSLDNVRSPEPLTGTMPDYAIDRERGGAGSLHLAALDVDRDRARAYCASLCTAEFSRIKSRAPLRGAGPGVSAAAKPRKARAAHAGPTPHVAVDQLRSIDILARALCQVGTTALPKRMAQLTCGAGGPDQTSTRKRSAGLLINAVLA